MRKIITTLLMLISMIAYAQKMDIDVNRLAEKLQLTEQQIEYISIITNEMNKDIDEALNTNGRRKVMKLRKAIDNDVRRMRKILTDEQFETYIQLFTTTLRNNFINEFVYELDKGRYFYGREVHRNQK